MSDELGAMLAGLREAAAAQEKAQAALAGAIDRLAHGAAPTGGDEAHALAALTSLLHQLTYAPSQAEAVQAVVSAAAQMLPNSLGTLGLETDDHPLAMVAAWDNDQIWQQWEAGPKHSELLARIAHLPMHEAVRLPLLHQGVTIGELRFWCATPNDDRTRQSAQLLALSASLALGALAMKRRLVQRSVRDPLTGLFNRRYMEDTLGREVHRARRNKGQIGLILCDLDGLAAYNDRYGNETGDRLLQAVGGLLLGSFRGSDVCCRVDGQRFVVILPDASLENTLRRAHEILAAVAEIQLAVRGEIAATATACAGIAALPTHANTPEELLAAAESGLMLAKQQGPGSAWVAEKVE